MRLTILLVIVAAAALALTNPTMADFETFAADQLEDVLQREAGESALGQALAGAGARIAGSYVDRVADRKDYVLYSLYTIDLDGPGQEANDWRFLGLGGRFVELHRPEAASER